MRSPCFQPAMGEQHAVRGAVGDRQRRGLGVAHPVRDGDQPGRVDQAVFRGAAQHHLAHQPLLRGDRIERVDQHVVADPPALHPRSDLRDLARDVEPDDHRHRHLDARHAVAGEHVVVVERGRAHADHRLALADLGIGEVGLQPERVDSAVFAQAYRAHDSPPPPVAGLVAELPESSPGAAASSLTGFARTIATPPASPPPAAGRARAARSRPGRYATGGRDRPGAAPSLRRYRACGARAALLSPRPRIAR